VFRGGHGDLLSYLKNRDDILSIDLIRLSSIGQIHQFITGGHPDSEAYDLIAQDIFHSFRHAGILDPYKSMQQDMKPE